MKTKPLDPIISEFATEEQAASYDRWFRAFVVWTFTISSCRL